MKHFLRDIAVVSAGQGAPQGDSNYCENGTPFVKAGNLQELIEGKPIQDIQQVSEEVAQKHKLKLYPKGTVLFAKSGMSCLKGYVYVLPCDSYVVSHLACITPRDEISDYLQLFFTYHKPNQLVKDAAYPSISLADIGNLEIDMKSADERQQIVYKFERIKKIIALRKAELLTLDELIKARFVEMFGNPVTNDKNWDCVTLNMVATKIGSGATPRGGKESYKENGISLIRSMNVHNGYFDYKDLAHISNEQAELLNNVVIENDDVLLNITGASVARCCVVPSDILPARVNQHVCIIRCKCILPVYLSHLLVDDSYQNKLWQIAGSGATREAITKQQVENLRIIMPPDELQNEFAEFVQQVDKSKVIVQKALDEAQLLFDSLMQKYFG